MTALCGGGTSAPDTGVSVGVAYGAAKIAQMLETYGAAWALEVVPLLVIPPIVASSFCASDPPAIPTFTSAEANALLQLQLGSDFVSGLSKMVDLVQHLVWYDICRCTSGTLTTLPAAPPAPSGTYIVQQPEPQASTSCDTFSTFTTVTTGGSSLTWRPAALPPASMTSILANYNLFFTSGSGSIDFSWDFFDINGTTMSTSPVYTWTGTTGVANVPVYVPAGTHNAHLKWSGTGSLVGSLNMDSPVFCNGAPPTGVQNPCCPPDATTQAQLNAILNLVTLIQRQIVPFGSIQGAAHSGLTGQGSFSVPRLLGVQVVLTTIPASYGIEVGSPDVHFDLGWLSASTPDGFIDETRVTRQTQAWYPRIMSDVNLIGYSFSPGVVATITEVEAEV